MTDELRASLAATLGDSYVIERELGGGGMSRVFLATDRTLGRPVAIKVLAPAWFDSVRAELRFVAVTFDRRRSGGNRIVPALTVRPAWHARTSGGGETAAL